MSATALANTIDKYIASFDKQLAISLFQLLQWNKDIRDNHMEVKISTKGGMYLYYVSVVSLSRHLAGLLYWRENLGCVNSLYKIFFEGNDRLDDSFYSYLTAFPFNAVGMTDLSIFI